MPRPSIGSMQCRAVRMSRVTLMSAVAAPSPPPFSENSTKTLSLQCSCTSGEPGCCAASMSVTAGNSSYSIVTARDVLGFRARRRQAHGDDLADEAELVGRQDRLGRVFEAAQRRIGRDRLDADQVARGEHDVAELLRARRRGAGGRAPPGCGRMQSRACQACGYRRRIVLDHAGTDRPPCAGRTPRCRAAWRQSSRRFRPAAIELGKILAAQIIRHDRRW